MSTKKKYTYYLEEEGQRKIKILAKRAAIKLTAASGMPINEERNETRYLQGIINEHLEKNWTSEKKQVP